MPRTRKLPTGMRQRGQIYYAWFSRNGRDYRNRLSGDFRVACEMLRELQAKADRPDLTRASNDVSWLDLKREFMRWADQAIRNPEQYRHDLEVFEAYCPVPSIQQVDQRYVLGFREWQLANGMTPRTVNKQVGTLCNMLNKGVAWGRIGSNPLADLKPLKHDSPKKERRSLELDEVTAIFEHSPEYLKPVWRMFMTTGIRRGELVNMRFEDVDFDRRCVIVRAATAKNHREREIPLDDAMLAEIERLRDEAPHRKPNRKTLPGRLSHDHVFVNGANAMWKNPGNILRSFYSICKKAGIEDACRNGSVDLHALRVTFTTLAMEHGANPKAVQMILGHSTLALTMNVYAKATDRAKRDAITALPFAAATGPEHVLRMAGEADAESEKACTSLVHGQGPKGAISDHSEAKTG